jgi:phage FluMu gp28-like protein
LLDASKRAICNKSRQIGMSHTTAAVAVLWGVFHGELTTVVSIGEAEALEVLDKARRHAEVLHALGSNMARLTRNREGGIGFASNGRVLALPSTGGRGYTGNVFLDEFGYHMHPGKVWDAAAPATGLGFRMRVASTPNGYGNDFHALWRSTVRGENDFSAHEIPIDLAIEQGFNVNLEECWQIAKGDPRLFDQMYKCKFLDNEMQYIPSGLVDKQSADLLEIKGGAHYAGLDIGKTIDKTVLTVLNRGEDGALRLAYAETSKRTDGDELQAMVDKAFEHFQIRRLCVDQSGLGAFPAEAMRKRHGFYKVEPISFTLQSKEAIATQLYTALASGTLWLPRTDAAIPSPPAHMRGAPPHFAAALREDICSIRREITTAGNVRYDAPHTDRGHADSAWSIALAVNAAGQAMPRGTLPADVAALF